MPINYEVFMLHYVSLKEKIIFALKNHSCYTTIFSVTSKKVLMVIDRNEYIEQLLAKRWNGKVKIVTGIRRSSKSFLLSTLFKNRLIEDGA